ncbi:MAG: hypothetical protein OEX07_05305, partial [Gammaproteobacteria bacterium]|nr:hypothetical protein [Gammaproteobacteria bacterium]
MPKNKLIHVVAVLFVSNLLWGCSSKDDEDASVWASTDAIYSAASITDSRATISSNGDIVLVWQEQETEERADTDKDAIFPSETHKVLYSKTSVNVKYYDSASGSWSSDKQLRVGHWEKLKSGIVDGAETVFQENINNTFIGNSVVAINSNGDAVVAWVQLGESADVVDDAGSDHLLFVSSYTAADSSWRVPLALSTNLTLNLSAKTPNNTT